MYNEHECIISVYYMILNYFGYYIMATSSESNIDQYFSVSENKITLNDEKVMKSENKEIIIGIDLGTTNSCVSVWKGGNFEIIPDINGNRTIPSIVSFTNKTRYVGQEAKNQMDLNPENTFYEIKRLIGRKYDDIVVINDAQFRTFNISNDNNNILVNTELKTNVINKEKYTPEEISAFILRELKYMAESYLRTDISKAVITVPAYFNDSQRQATKDAAIIAGLECVRIINEPTAAGLAYGFANASMNKDDDLNIIVYDLGGGTLDVSLLNISRGLCQVVASTGNTHLGGADFDVKLMGYCLNYFKKKNNIAKLNDVNVLAMQQLRKACENAKKLLSTTCKAIIAVKDFYDDKNLYVVITRDQFERLCGDLFILCIKSVEDVLKSAGFVVDDIDEILLVGGATRMPLIRNNLKLYFRGKEPNCSLNPDEVVSVGAAIQGYLLSHGTDPFSENVVLLDIIPLSLGVETIGGVMSTIVPRNSIIPITRKKKFTTDSDNETSVKIKIFEGERKMTKDNFFVGEFELKGLEPAPRGIAEIEVSFKIDINGIISVTAEDLKNDINKNSLIITGNKGRLSEEKIKELVEEAANMELNDRLEREKKQLFYEIEDLCSNIITNVNNDEFKLKDSDKQMISDDIDKIMKWLKEKGYETRNKKEYTKVLNRIKKKYGTLMLKMTQNLDGLANNNNTNDKNCTSVYGQEELEEDNEIYEMLKNEDFGLTNEMTDEVKKELIQLRDILIDLCHTVLEVITSKCIKINKDHVGEIKDYIDEILLWVYVQQKISKTEFIQKIEEVNNICNDTVGIYEKEQKEIFESNDKINNNIKRYELEQLCYALLCSIESNMFSLEDDLIDNISNKINSILEWLLEININEYNIPEESFQNEIDNINNMCNKLFNSMTNHEIKDTCVIIPESTNINANMGTTIEQLKQKSQK